MWRRVATRLLRPSAPPREAFERPPERAAFKALEQRCLRALYGPLDALSTGMRRTALLLSILVSAALVGCDQSAFPTVAGLGGGSTTSSGTGTGTGNGSGTGTGNGSGTGTTTTLVITPGSATINVGGSIQLIANVFNDQVRWQSDAPTIAGVSPSGMVVGLNPGVAPIRVVLLADTTRQAVATITVTGTAGTTGGTTGNTGGTTGGTGGATP